MPKWNKQGWDWVDIPVRWETENVAAFLSIWWKVIKIPELQIKQRGGGGAWEKIHRLI